MLGDAYFCSKQHDLKCKLFNAVAFKGLSVKEIPFALIGDEELSAAAETAITVINREKMLQELLVEMATQKHIKTNLPTNLDQRTLPNPKYIEASSTQFKVWKTRRFLRKMVTIQRNRSWIDITILRKLKCYVTMSFVLRNRLNLVIRVGSL
tara:strand:+ start:27 stop:482 length:456 start_codon:yes stop_codon:yes gene_type:complete